MKLVLSSFVVASLCTAPAWAQSDRSANSETRVQMPEPAMLGAHLARGVKAAKPSTGVKLLTYHNGELRVTTSEIHAIFWGPSWGSASFAADKLTGIDSFYGGASSTSYLRTNTEYTDAAGTHVSPSTSYRGHVTDLSASPKAAPKVSAVLEEVCKMFPNPTAGAYYPVYVDTPRGHAGYCAWHSWASCPNGPPIQFGFFFNLDGDPGCDPDDSSGLHSQGLSALANVSGHEMSEMLTDPRGTGWFDSNGEENADKCAWTFGASLLNFGGKANLWKIQGNWSNDAYDSDSGYTDPTRGLVRGCIDGTN
jgi:hypothetical protein